MAACTGAWTRGLGNTPQISRLIRGTMASVSRSNQLSYQGIFFFSSVLSIHVRGKLRPICCALWNVSILLTFDKGILEISEVLKLFWTKNSSAGARYTGSCWLPRAFLPPSARRLESYSSKITGRDHYCRYDSPGTQTIHQRMKKRQAWK